MSHFKFGTTRMAGAFFVEYTDENAVKWRGDKAMNDLVGLFPTYGALFEHFGKAADEHAYTVAVNNDSSYITMKVPATKPDGTPFELVFTLFRKD